MLLRNKKTGEIATLTLSTNGEDMIIMGNDMLAHITKLSELKDYEDYEELKDYWFINNYDRIEKEKGSDNAFFVIKLKQIGNYFETKEEAEKAVEKLKAWKRLKDARVSFRVKLINHKWYLEPTSNSKRRTLDESHELFKDVMLIFGGENE